jgi:hypothetical protein
VSKEEIFGEFSFRSGIEGRRFAKRAFLVSKKSERFSRRKTRAAACLRDVARREAGEGFERGGSNTSQAWRAG